MSTAAGPQHRTGDQLPTFSTPAIEGLLPADRALVGNGRGDVAHEDFRKQVHDVLVESGPHPDQGPWRECERRLYSPAVASTPTPPAACWTSSTRCAASWFHGPSWCRLSPS